ncbi:HEAT repeat domain-containing protein [Melittangium boletus]|uniref:HEAT repeat domain-containing protein n=1 Tax=Melittangium boletus TaxID=83453 RepID=UPI003DA6C5B5
MRSPTHLVAALLLACPTLALAQADARTASLARTLKQGALATQKVQAARVLGESEDPEALAPLCAGLADEAPEVRAAAAKALEALAEPGALECLEAREDEPDATVQQALASAVKATQALRARPTRMVVMLGALKDTTGTLSPELVKLTEARMRRKLFQLGADLAPAGQGEAEAKAQLAKGKLPGYRLLSEIRPGSAGGLKLSVMCLRYPGKHQLLGNVEVQGSDEEPGELLAALAPRAIEDALASMKK